MACSDDGRIDKAPVIVTRKPLLHEPPCPNTLAEKYFEGQV
jgi:hypothetical protein